MSIQEEIQDDLSSRAKDLQVQLALTQDSALKFQKIMELLQVEERLARIDK